MDGLDGRRGSGPKVVPGDGRGLGIEVDDDGGASLRLVSHGESDGKGGLA